ncbi:MAG: GNAT family N-acetyltransferase [Terriglobales bacterium]
MHTIRPATHQDASLIAAQRVTMFQDNDLAPTGTWAELEEASARWLEKTLGDGSYIGWIVEEHDGLVSSSTPRVLGGAGLWLMDWPPHYLHLESRRGYLLNFYVVPEARRSGIAAQLVRLAVAECGKRGIRVATLHASAMGRPVYERLGWANSNEMKFDVELGGGSTR